MALTDTDLRPDITLIRSLLAPFSSQQRLYELVLHPAARDDASCPWLQAGSLLVEGFTAVDALHEIGWREIIVLALDGADDASFGSLVGRRASLAVTLADGTRTTFSGLLHEVALLGRDGALARLRLRLVPWLWLLSQRRASRLWQDCSIIDIVDAVFARYAPHAA